MSVSLPAPGGPLLVTDGGIETDLIFNRGWELEEFAAFPLVASERGRAELADYYAGYAEIARACGAGLLLTTPTWRANADWAARLGYDAAALDRLNRDAVAFAQGLRAHWSDLPNVVVSGMVGPRGDGYVPGPAMTLSDAAAYHRAQIESFAEAGVDLVEALTLTTPGEAAGIVTAARAVGLPVGILFTVETDGRLPDGTPLGEAIERADEAGGTAYVGVNCAHPSHLLRGLGDPEAAAWVSRIAEVRPNASTRTHAELDTMTELDIGDIGLLVSTFDALRAHLPGLSVVGGCCGTDTRHVAALWGQGRPD